MDASGAPWLTQGPSRAQEAVSRPDTSVKWTKGRYPWGPLDDEDAPAPKALGSCCEGTRELGQGEAGER